MADHSLSQVEDALAAQLLAWVPLADWTVMVSESVDLVIEDPEQQWLVITTVDYSFEVADENWMTLHTAIISVEALSGTPTVGTISRVNRNALAAVIAAIAADRTLGIRIQDIQESNMAPTEGNGKDVGSASIHFTVMWFTPRGDHTTIPA